MGIVTNIEGSYDAEAQVHRIFVRTRFAVSTRSALNRVAGRVAVETGVGQRTLVAAAYDKLGIDLAWNTGLSSIAPERKFENAQKIKFEQSKIQEASQFMDILPKYLRDYVQLEEYKQPGEFSENPEMLYMWEIPYGIETKMRGNKRMGGK